MPMNKDPFPSSPLHTLSMASSFHSPPPAFAFAFFSFFLACSLSLAFSLPLTNLQGTLAFASTDRPHYAFDIFSLPIPHFPHNRPLPPLETKLTDGESVNYNGHFVTASAKQVILHSLQDKLRGLGRGRESVGEILAYVSERQGRANLFFNIFFSNDEDDQEWLSNGGSVAGFQKVEVQAFSNDAQPFLRDRPSVTGSSVVYVSTQQRSQASRESWAAVYSTDLFTGVTKRLTPEGVADYSPAVSPSGEWVIVASDQGRGWQGEVHELKTDLYIFKAKDGSHRSLLVEHGGWPSWSDESTVFYHRQAEDGWWSVYKATFSDSLASVTIERVTPPGIHAFTPAASRTGEWIAVATRRPESEYRHIEIYHLQSETFHKVTQLVSPTAHHYNPFLSSDSKNLGYHKCRGGKDNSFNSATEVNRLKSVLIPGGRDLVEIGAPTTHKSFPLIIPHLEYIQSPLPQLSLLRVDGTFPTFSPDGSLIAYIPNLRLAGVYVMQLDGSGSRKIYSERAFGIAWDWKREGVVYTSSGPSFATEQATVHIVSIFNAHRIAAGEDVPLSSKVLTKEGTANNAFPSASPDGKFVVFRSGRSGHKNLYIMDAMLGEGGGLWRLTEGPWTDTMCNWSPDGQWIVFASDRENPGEGDFNLYLIHPDGTGLHKVFNSSTGGLANHPSFSPDSKTLLFTTDYAGVSAEPISMPHQFQPAGEIFLSKVDGSDLLRLTHNFYEDGTPSWGRKFISASNLSTEGEGFGCLFDDDNWLKSSGKSVRVSC